MKLFKRQQTNLDLQVDRLMQAAVDANEKFADSIVIRRLVENKANMAIRKAILQLENMIETGDVEYSWYGNLSNYKVELTLEELAHLFNHDELDKFNELSKRYRIANEERNKK